jgi:hypothetical protein
MIYTAELFVGGVCAENETILTYILDWMLTHARIGVWIGGNFYDFFFALLATTKPADKKKFEIVCFRYHG